MRISAQGRTQALNCSWEYQTYGDKAFVGKGHLKPADAELRKLRKENERLRMENEILKKAAAYFAKHPADGSSSPKRNWPTMTPAQYASWSGCHGATIIAQEQRPTVKK